MSGNLFNDPRIYIYANPKEQEGCNTRLILHEQFNRFEFKVFLLLDLLPYRG